MVKKRGTGDDRWEEARGVLRKQRSKFRRRKGVVDLHVAPQLDATGRPNGKPEIMIEVERKLEEKELRANQVLPKEIEGIPVSVVDIRGRVPIGKPSLLRLERDDRGGVAMASPTALAPALVTFGSGSRIVAIDAAGNQLSGQGSISAVVFDSGGNPFFLTCSHVLSTGGVALPSVLVGSVDQGTLGISQIGTAVSTRGHDANNDCALIRPSVGLASIETRIKDPDNPGVFFDPEASGHYRFEQLTQADVQNGTSVIHVGAVSAGQVSGTVIGINGSFNATGSTPIMTGLIVIRPTGGQDFSQAGDSGALIVSEANKAVVGIVVGIRDNGDTVACHFHKVLDFFRTSFPIDL